MISSRRYGCDRDVGRCWWIFALVICLSACNRGSDYTLYRLESGQTVKVIGVTKMYFSKGDPALMLKYETDLPIDNVAALRQEAEAIWPTFRVDVERAGLRGAILSANSIPSGIIWRKRRLYNFIIVRDDGGGWHFE